MSVRNLEINFSLVIKILILYRLNFLSLAKTVQHKEANEIIKVNIL